MDTAQTPEAAQAVPAEPVEKKSRTHSRLSNKVSRAAVPLEGSVHASVATAAVDLTVSTIVPADCDAPACDQADAELEELEGVILDETISSVTFDASPDASPDAAANQVNSALASEPSVVTEPSGNAVEDLSAMIQQGDQVSRKDLVALLENFVRIIKTDEPAAAAPASSATGLTTVASTAVEVAKEKPTVITPDENVIDDRTVEIDQLRGLVIEAQDTIIKLLTDRVEDRSRIATLEAQLALIPDLQAQADRAMSVAVRTEEYRTELNKMKFELDRFRLFRVRIEAEQRKSTIFNRIQKWLFSRPNAADETLQTKG